MTKTKAEPLPADQVEGYLRQALWMFENNEPSWLTMIGLRRAYERALLSGDVGGAVEIVSSRQSAQR